MAVELAEGSPISSLQTLKLKTRWILLSPFRFSQLTNNQPLSIIPTTITTNTQTLITLISELKKAHCFILKWILVNYQPNDTMPREI